MFIAVRLRVYSHCSGVGDPSFAVDIVYMLILAAGEYNLRLYQVRWAIQARQAGAADTMHANMTLYTRFGLC